MSVVSSVLTMVTLLFIGFNESYTFKDAYSALSFYSEDSMNLEAFYAPVGFHGARLEDLPEHGMSLAGGYGITRETYLSIHVSPDILPVACAVSWLATILVLIAVLAVDTAKAWSGWVRPFFIRQKG